MRVTSSYSPRKTKSLLKTKNIQSSSSSPTKQSVCYQSLFQVAFPQEPKTISKIVVIPLVNYKIQSPQVHLDSYRKHSIKEKIKFRVKQNMLNQLRKDFQESSILPSPEKPRAQSAKKRAKSVIYVQGTSNQHFSRENFNSRNFNSIQHSKNIELKINSSVGGSPPSKYKKSRNIWSHVRMRAEERPRLARKQQRALMSAMSLSRQLDQGNIQPWAVQQDIFFE